jgi:hypothetical protein
MYGQGTLQDSRRVSLSFNGDRFDHADGLGTMIIDHEPVAACSERETVTLHCNQIANQLSEKIHTSHGMSRYMRRRRDPQ